MKVSACLGNGRFMAWKLLVLLLCQICCIKSTNLCLTLKLLKYQGRLSERAACGKRIGDRKPVCIMVTMPSYGARRATSSFQGDIGENDQSKFIHEG